MKMSASDYIKLPYTVVIIPDEDVFFVKIKELPGCISQGNTIEEAFKMIEEAKELWIEAALEDGYDFPLPESMQENKYSGKLSLRISKSLHRNLSEKAKEDGISLNRYINDCLVKENTIDLVTDMMKESQDKIEETISTIESVSFKFNSTASSSFDKGCSLPFESQSMLGYQNFGGKLN